VAGTNAPSGAARGGIVAINVTPMVDILLVLLVILMATATYVVYRNLQVNLPAAVGDDGPVAPVATVTIAADGSLSLDGDPVTEAGLQTRFQDLRGESDQATVVINADRAALHGMVVHVIDMARLARLTRFSVQVVRVE
jgi:biopolymer transport protein ExbD